MKERRERERGKGGDPGKTGGVHLKETQTAYTRHIDGTYL